MILKKILCLFLIFVAYSKQIIVINKGVISRVPVAVYVIPSKDSSLLSANILGIINSDLNNCGLIRSIDESVFTQQLFTISEKPIFKSWKDIGAHFLVVCNFKRGFNNQVMAEVKIFDTITGRLLDFYKISTNKENKRKLAHSISNKVYFRITGDEGYFNDKIAFVKELNGKKNISIMDVDGFNEINVVTAPSICLSPKLSPDGKTIVYFSYKRVYSKLRRRNIDVVGEIFIQDLVTAKRRQLNIPNNKFMSYAPNFSPDGKKLIFSLSDSHGGSSIYTCDISGNVNGSGNFKRLSYSQLRSIDTSPSYSPDGKYIVFNSDRSGTQQLYIMDSNGLNVRRLSFGAGRYATPVWSPRNDFIAFSRITSGVFYIGLIRPDGTGERMIASGYMVESPSWSKNGRVIFFTKIENKNGKYSINSIDVTGNYERLIKHNASDPSVGSFS